jgi:hypothetical protein
VAPQSGGYIGGGLNPLNLRSWVLTGDPNAIHKHNEPAQISTLSVATAIRRTTICTVP